MKKKNKHHNLHAEQATVNTDLHFAGFTNITTSSKHDVTYALFAAPKLNNSEAAARCHGFGGRLAVLDADDKVEQINRDLLPSLLSSGPDAFADLVWIDLHQRNQSDYVWGTGQPLANGTGNRWWYKGEEPNNPSEQCVAVATKSIGWPRPELQATFGFWADVHCRIHESYICEQRESRSRGGDPPLTSPDARRQVVPISTPGVVFKSCNFSTSVDFHKNIKAKKSAQSNNYHHHKT